MLKRLRFTVVLVVVGMLFTFGPDGRGVAHAESKITVPIGGGQQVLMHKIAPQMSDTRAQQLVLWADRSTCTRKPLTEDCDGKMRTGDRVVVTNDHIFWLDLTRDSLSSGGGGGGFLHGLWTLVETWPGFAPQYDFLYVEEPTTYWAPNELLAGADGVGINGAGQGIQFRLGNDRDIIDTNSLMAENADNVQLTQDGIPITSGLFAGSGVMYQTSAYLTHIVRDSAKLSAAGFDSVTDVNTTPALISQIKFTLTYRFSPSSAYFRQEVTLQVENNPTSPLGTYVLTSDTLGPRKNTTKWWWSLRYFTAPTGLIRNAWVAPTTCSATPTYAANTPHLLNIAVASNSGLDWFETSQRPQAGPQQWVLSEEDRGGRRLSVSLPAGFDLPDHVQATLNGYVPVPYSVVSLAPTYFSSSQCGEAPWQVGDTHRAAGDYRTK